MNKVSRDVIKQGLLPDIKVCDHLLLGVCYVEKFIEHKLQNERGNLFLLLQAPNTVNDAKFCQVSLGAALGVEFSFTLV